MDVEKLSSLDLSFLDLEDAGTPMHVGAVLLFRTAAGGQDAASAQRLAAVLRARVATVPRLRRRLARPALGPPAWVEDTDFEPQRHVLSAALPVIGSREELASRVAELLAAPLDRHRPLWELHVLAGSVDGSVAVLAKIHHALADGLRAVVLGLALFDDLGDSAPRDQPVQVVAPAADVRPTGPARRLTRTIGDLLAAGRLLVDPRTGPGELARQVGQVRDATRISVSVARSLMRPAPASPLSISPRAVRRFTTLNGDAAGPSRQVAMLRLDLDDVHRVRKTHGGTVNDVLLTVVAGGLRCWLDGRGQSLRQPLRALVPVSRPHPDPADTAGNRLSGYLVELPVHEPDPLRRLHTIRAAMTANKASGPTRGPGAFPLLANLLPSPLHRFAAPVATPLAAPIASRLFNTVITQVPLPDLGFTLAGARLTEIYPVAPLAAGQALGVAISTYQRVAHIGLHVDQVAIPDLDRLGDHVTSALAELADIEQPPAMPA